MSSDPSHLQLLSEKLFNEKNYLIMCDPCLAEECVHRTVVNRSYYAAYNYFKDWASNDNKMNYDENKALKHYNRIATEKNKRSVGIHKVFILFLLDNARKHNNDYVIRYCANNLEYMRKDRVDADYHFDKNICNSIAKTNCLLSRKIIKHVNELKVV